MKKIVKNTFIILLLSLLSALAYVANSSETEKFNQDFIQIKQLNSNLDIKLNEYKNMKISLNDEKQLVS